MEYRRVINAMALTAGGLFAVVGLGLVALGTFATFSQGRAGFVFSGVAMLAMAVPLVAYAFSSRVAAFATFAVLVLFSSTALWAAFGSTSTTPTLGFKLAAVGFCLLLLGRIGLALRRRRSRAAT
jgi:hypothetical protein